MNSSSLFKIQSIVVVALVSLLVSANATAAGDPSKAGKPESPALNTAPPGATQTDNSDATTSTSERSGNGAVIAEKLDSEIAAVEKACKTDLRSIGCLAAKSKMGYQQATLETAIHCKHARMTIKQKRMMRRKNF